MQQTITTANVQTSLHTATFPCTIVGLRWDFSIRSITAANDNVTWILCIVRNGVTANTISQSNGADIWTPEQDIMAFGNMSVLSTAAESSEAFHIQGTTKTMRKIQPGDILAFISFGSIVNGAIVQGAVQFFCKT